MNTRAFVITAACAAMVGCVTPGNTYRSDQSAPAYGAADEPYPVLNAYGTWYDYAPYGRVWQPAVNADWRPYTNGQWVWTDRGWMWDSDEPFGWVVYHYGYWTETAALGWVWVPGDEWSPARVVWYDDNDYVCWAPMPPPHASFPEVYQPGYENVWTVVPTPQFTRLNVGAYRVTPAAPARAPSKQRGVQRPPEIITIQGATHQLISPRKTEEDRVRNGRRTVERVRVVPPPNAPAPSPVYGSPSRPDVVPPPSAPIYLPGTAPATPQPSPGIFVTPPPAGRVVPAPSTPAPPPSRGRVAPVPGRIAPVPAPANVAPAPGGGTPAPAPVHITPAPAPSRAAAPAKVEERKVEKRDVKKEEKKPDRK